MFPLQLFGSVGADQDNSIEDVTSVASALAENGETNAYQAARTGQWDSSLDNSVRVFQENNGLDVDGILMPRGPTQGAINRMLQTRRVSEQEKGRTSTGDWPTHEATHAEIEIPSRTATPYPALPTRRSNPYQIAREQWASSDPNDKWWRGPSDSSHEIGRSEPSDIPAVGSRTAPSGGLDFDFRPKRDAMVETRSPISAAKDEDRILADRGYKYRADPMGRLGWGDWVGPDGIPLADEQKQRLFEEVGADRPVSPTPTFENPASIAQDRNDNSADHP